MTGQGESGGGPPKLERVSPGPRLPEAEMSAAAALAAGLAYQGSLRDDGPLRLYYLAAAAQASGALGLETPRGRFDLHFKRGVVEHAASSLPEDDLGRFLVGRGVVTADALADAERLREGHGGDLVAALASLRVMNPADSFRFLQEHGVAVVTRALAAEEGTFRWSPGAPLPPSSFPLGSRWGMLCDAVRRLDAAGVAARLGDRARRATVRSGGRIDLAQLKLTAHEARAAALFQGRASPDQLAAAHPLLAVEVLRVALLLAETELLAFGEVVAAAPPAIPRPASAPPAAPAPAAAAAASVPAAAPAAQAPRAAAGSRAEPRRPAAEAKPPVAAAPPPRAIIPQDAEALQALQARLAGADHFEALGVKRDATAAQIKAAYFQLARTYHPDAGPPGETPELKKLRADIFGRLGEAWRELGDDGRRAEYLRQLASGGVGQVDASAIFQAEELFTKATVLVRTRQYPAAEAALAEAMQLNPDEAEFGVWAAWVKFLTAADRQRQHAESAAAMEAALKKVPRCMSAYLFLGQMAKLMGEPSVAEKHLQRGLALAPDHAELARELKYLRK